MSREITNKEAISNLNHIYGIVSSDIQRSLDLAIKALEEKPQGDLISLLRLLPQGCQIDNDYHFHIHSCIILTYWCITIHNYFDTSNYLIFKAPPKPLPLTHF